jgi:hypothetical protein
MQPEHSWIRLGDGTPLQHSICSKQKMDAHFHASKHGTVQREKIVTERGLPVVVAVPVEENRGSSASQTEGSDGQHHKQRNKNLSQVKSQLQCKNINRKAYTCSYYMMKSLMSRYKQASLQLQHDSHENYIVIRILMSKCTAEDIRCSHLL